MHEWLHQFREFWNSLHTGAINDLGPWSYVALMVLVATEGPLSTLVGAAAAAADLLDVRWVLVATIAGNIVGDIVWYSVGYMNKLDTLFHYGKWLGVKRSQLDRLEARVQAHATTMILIAKVAYGLIVPTLVAAGLARVPLRKWLPIVFVVETLWSILLVYVGYHMTGYIAELERGLEIAVGVVWVAIIVGVIVWLKRRKQRSKESELSNVPHEATPVAALVDNRAPFQPSEVRLEDADTDTRAITVGDENGYHGAGSYREILFTEENPPISDQGDARGEPVGEIGGKGRSA